MLMIKEPTTSTGLAPLMTTLLEPFKNGVNAKSVRQQGLTNCPLPAILSAMARAWPGKLRKMIKKKKQKAQAWFYGKQPPSTGPFELDSYLTVKFQNASIDISPYLYVNGAYKPRFGRSEDGGWVSYIEKAYVAYRGGYQYEKLNFLAGENAVTVERVMEDLVHDFNKIEINENGGTIYYDLEASSDETNDFGTTKAKDKSSKKLRGAIKSMLKRAKSRPTVATTPSGPGYGLVGMHTYAVLYYNSKKGRVTLFDAMKAVTKTLKLKEFHDAFDAVYQARRQ